MNLFSETASATWGIAALATSGVIIRPWRLPEAVWAVLGAATLVALGLLPWTDAVSGVLKGLDVYLFLLGMMLLAELARSEGLFDWLAALAVERARGSPQQLFTLIYIVGTLVTVCLSNDATAVVLTPAVYAAARAAPDARARLGSNSTKSNHPCCAIRVHLRGAFPRSQSACVCACAARDCAG